MKSANLLNFSESKIRSLPPAQKVDGKAKNYYKQYDAGSKGLCIRVDDRGKKVFFFYKRRNGQDIVISLGEWGSADDKSGITVTDARAMAARHYGEVCNDVDPREAKRQVKDEPTVGELFRAYIDGYARDRCRTWKEMEANYRRCFEHWGNRKASSIRRMDVQNTVNKIGVDRGNHTANRVLDDLKAMYNWGSRKNLINCENPCIGVDKCKVDSGGRQRFLQPNEMAAFFKAVELEPEKDIRDFVYLALYTAMREGNILAMRWECVDFELGSWHIPGAEFKNGDPHNAPLTEGALEVLKSRHNGEISGWVFPSKRSSVSGHWEEPKAGWKRILARAKLTDLRIHDLRRSMGSYMAIANVNTPLIGKALGHKSLTAAARYQRVNYDPVRAAMEQAQDIIKGFAKVATDA